MSETTERAELTEEEAQFVNDVVQKELFFSLASGEPSGFLTTITDCIEWEKQKLMDESIGSDDYQRDIQIAEALLAKLSIRG